MFYLPPLTALNEEKFYSRIKDRIIKARDSSGLSLVAKAFLTPAKIKEIVCGKPTELMQHHLDIIPLLDAGSNIPSYNNYLLAKKNINSRRSPVEIALCNQFDPLIEQLSAVFNYDTFISAHKITSYELAAILDRNTCTYCNRLYTATVVVLDANSGRINNGTRLIRPCFDHWFSKSRYPILALSLYNLIPSCTICNSSIKSDADFSLAKHEHPYCSTAKQAFKFNYSYRSVHSNNVTIEVKSKTKIARTLKAFKIEEIYNAHSSFELKDLLELRYKYPENYIATLFNDTFKLAVGEKEAYRMIFGVEYDDENHHKRPFSKFKMDILEKLGVVI